MSDPEIPLRLLSLGAGVQSTTIALMAAEGLLRLDAAIFADTGWEPRGVYEHLDRLTTRLSEAGIPVYRVSAGNLRNDVLVGRPASAKTTTRYAAIPLHLRKADGSAAAGRRQCTKDYKLVPIRRQIRTLLGFPPPLRVPRRFYAEVWIGFSTDEIYRVKDNSPGYERNRYPLLDLDMSRKDCERWLRSRGWSAQKSACIGCPYHGNRQWRDMRDNDPESWADAVEFDAALRLRTSTLRAEQYLHRSLLPLSIAPIDVVTRGEWKERQGDILDVLAEEGDPDGCSPHGCRSGSAA